MEMEMTNRLAGVCAAIVHHAVSSLGHAKQRRHLCGSAQARSQFRVIQIRIVAKVRRMVLAHHQRMQRSLRAS